MPQLKNLHEILRDSAEDKFRQSLQKTIDDVPEALFESCNEYTENCRKKRTCESTTQSFQVDMPVKKHMDEICRANGTTASGFLRECANRLVAEYVNGR